MLKLIARLTFVTIFAGLFYHVTTYSQTAFNSCEMDTHDKRQINAAKHIQDITMLVYGAPHHDPEDCKTGSGTFRTTKDGQLWILTCAHVMDKAKYLVLNPDGTATIKFNPAYISKIITKNGQAHSEHEFRAEVIRYSLNIDFVLLKPIDSDYIPPASLLLPDAHLPAVGTPVVHCGNFFGGMFHSSVTFGVISFQGRPLDHGGIIDQTSAPVFPGSSGSAVCNVIDNTYLGMVLRRNESTCGLYMPIRAMREWAVAHGIGFIFDDSLPIPTYDEMMAQSILD